MSRPHWERQELEILPVAIAICGDGFQPSKGKHQKDHSMFCLAVSALNLPPWMRTTVSGSLLNMIIPGPREPKDAQPFLDIPLDELLLLYEVGVPTWDAHR